MQWSKLQRTAKSAGHLIYAMDQWQTAPLSLPGPWGDLRGGYCLGLSVRWISLQYAELDFPHTSQEATGFDLRAVFDQNFVQDQYAAGRLGLIDAMFKALLSRYQLVLSSSLRGRFPGMPFGEEILSVCARAYGLYALRFSNAADSHALAIRHARDGRFHLFDANHGHFAVAKPAAFITFLDKHIKAAGYAGGYDDVWVRGVKPPIAAGRKGGI